MFGKTTKYWISCKGVYTSNEIAQQPNTWKKTLHQIKENQNDIQKFINQVILQEDFDIVLCGAGTSEYVGNSIYPFLNEQLQYKVKSYATTDIVAAPEKYLSKTKPTLLISYGRSGDSPESVGALQAANAVCENIYHLFITCNKDGALSKAAKLRNNALAINLTPETLDKSFAMTSSYTNMALATLLCFQLDRLSVFDAMLEDLGKAANRIIENDWLKLKEFVEVYDFKRIVYLGSNCLKGTAQESQLKMLELTQGRVTTMYDSPMGFRHGPKSIVNDDTLVVVYVSDDSYTREYEKDLITEISLQRKNNRLIVIGNHCKEAYSHLSDLCFDLNLQQNYDNAYLGLCYILYAQILAFFKSYACGIQPDDPCPSGEVNRVVKGVTIYPYIKK